MRKIKAASSDAQHHYCVFFKTYIGSGEKRRLSSQFTAHVAMPTPLEYFSQFQVVGDAIAKHMDADAVFVCSATSILGPTRPPKLPLGPINSLDGPVSYQYRVYFLAFHRLEDHDVKFHDCSINVWLDQPIEYYSDVSAVTAFCASQAQADWAVLASWTAVAGYDRSVTSQSTTTLSINVSGTSATALN